MKDFVTRAGLKGARSRSGCILLLFLLAGFVLWPGQPLHAANRQWTGDASGLWSDPDNWFPIGVPQNGDSLTFPAVGPLDATSMVNDLTGLTVDNMTFTAGGYALNGNALTFIQGITDSHTSGGLNIVRCNIQFSGVRGRLNSLGTGLLEINGTTTLVNNQELITTPVVANLTVSGAIVGSGSLIKRDDGALFLRGSANNTYSGATRVEGGELHLAKTGAARAISADVTVDARFIGNAALFDDLPGQYPPALSMLLTNGGDWFITNGATVTNLFLHNGALGGTGLLNLECDVTTEGFCPVACSLNLGQQSRTFFVNRDSILREEFFVDGHIIGPLGPNSSGLIKDGRGTLTLNTQNTYLGPTLVKRGELRVEHGGALGSTGGGGETRIQGATLTFVGPLTVPESIVVEETSESSTIQYSGNVLLTGRLTLGDHTRLEGGSSSRLEISGPIDGPEGLGVVGGTVRLSGGAPNTFGGDVNVSPISGHPRDCILELAKPDNVVAVPGSISLSGSGTNASVLRSMQNGGVNEVVLSYGSSWEMNGHVASPGLLRFFGPSVFVDTGGGQLQFGPGAVIMNSYGGGPPARIIGRVAFLALTNELQLSGNSLTHIQGQVTGGATILQKTQSNAGDAGGTLILDGDNQSTGPFFVEAGRLQIGSATALGSTAAGTFVNNNASLALDGGVTVGFEPLTLNTTNAAALASLGPITNVWRGNVTLQRTAGISVPDPAGVLRFESFFGCCPSIITGPGGLTKSGPGAVVITGTVANNYAGPTTVNDGLLEASRTQGPALSSNVAVSGASSILRTGRTPAPQALPAAARMTVQNGALWTMNSVSFENLSSLLGDGRLEIATGSALTISNSVSCEFTGQISGAGALNKFGLATFRVTGNSPDYTGPATVFDGTYKVDAQFLNGPVTVKVSSILRGTGAIGDVVVENGGVVRADSDGPGRLGGELVMNSANFQNGGVLGLAFYGPHPTGGNDNLFVNNAVTLTSPSLSSGFQYAPRDGDVIALINKNAAGAVSGAFSGFPEGALRFIGGVPVVMSYVGGDGNDVTLTVTNLPLRGGGTQVASGNGGGALVPNDCSQLTLIVTNRGAITLTGLHGTLRSLTDGVTVTMAESAYPNLSPSARGSNAKPFQIRTEPTFPCGGGAQFELVLTSSNFPPTAIAYTLVGSSGFGLNFDGRDDQVEVSTNAFSGVANNFTIELWANPTATRAESAETNNGLSGVSVPLRQLQRFAVFPHRADLAYGATHAGAGLSIGRNGISVYEHAANFLPSRLVYSNALSGWTHVALVYANRRPRLYVNGALVRSSTTVTFPFIHASASLGGSTQGDFGNFRGQLDELRIWNVALSETQIQTNMSRSLTGTEPGLVTYFHCDEGVGSTLIDAASASPNFSGTLTDGAAFVFPGVVPFGDGDCNGGGACESCLVVNGRFDTNALESVRSLVVTGVPSICDPPKTCPGFTELPDAPVRHVLHHFTNSTAAELCVTAQLRFDCPGTPPGLIGVAAYLGEFRINQPCSSFLGDDGAFGLPSPPFSFRVPPNTNIVLVVTARDTNLLCDTYALELFGLPCPPPTLHIAKDAAPDKVLLQWSSAYPDFRLQSANSLNGPGQSGFGNVATTPVLSGGKFAVTNATTVPQQFFQLVK